MDFELPDFSALPQGFNYPNSFLKVIKLNLLDLDPWYFMTNNDVKIRIKGMRKRYPNRILIPFARRGDNDDVACFELNNGDIVQIVHDFASAGYEQRQTYKNFWEWFKSAIDEMIEYED